MGVTASLAGGLSASWIVHALAPPQPGGSAFLHLVTLPIALLLPALALVAALIGWQAWRASGWSAWLALPLLAALASHALAVAFFVQIVIALFVGT
jgi:hypothetical protein